ncbi:hypothetical protein Cgig2_006110 [Carnegiea gigantea]|uniref:Uncharacterized protein n=1 Tax=Carnegiea gigantea TaxID=171969 RepID=A0A9Q1L0A3_9CARY|nr:hypothetical protein Cgig2_006110 [Carnegiea gigantea]
MVVPRFVKHISRCYACNLRSCLFFIRSSVFLRNLNTGSSQVSSGNHDTYSWNTKITSCFKRGDVHSARKMFDEMPQRNVVTWNCMISGFARNHMTDQARETFDAMPTKNLVSWTAMLSGYIGCCKVDEARKLFEQMPNEMKNHVCWDIMLNGYIKMGRIIEARELFDQSYNRNLGLYNRMLNGYVQMGYVDEAYGLFSSMPEHDVATWTSMITCYARAGLMNKAKSILDDMPFEKDAMAWTAIIRGYIQNGAVDEAFKLFVGMPNRDIVAWNCMIDGFVKHGRLQEAIDLYERMPRRNIISSNSILYGFVQEGDVISARNFLEKVMTHKDITSWNTVITGYQTEEALLLFSQMLRDGLKPDQTTYVTLASICGALALQSWGEVIHLRTKKSGYMNDTLVSSSLISMYSKCGLIKEAVALFGNTEERDIVTWNTIIVAQAYHGSTGKALEHYSAMIQAGCQPSHVTFLALLTACAHWGLVEEGKKYFKSMKSEWNISPLPEHYACMVDLFGRSGMLYEAYELIKQFPADLPSYAWETLLNCCKVHGNFELGEIVSQKILDTNPSNAQTNVLLSNIYAAKGSWDESANVRTGMKQKNMKKEVGCSWVEVGGSVCYQPAAKFPGIAGRT